jgi:hypothetical protein
MRVPFGEWLPDIPPLENPGLTVAKNCLPFGSHYASFPSLTPYSTNALAGPALGFISTTDKDGASFAYAADASALYRLADSTFYDATRGSGSYATDGYDRWEFAQWGERIIATNYTDDIQQITLGASNFAALAGSPPKARHMAVIRNFLVLGNVTDWSSGVALANRVHWSGFENVETWVPALSTQCDYQDLQGEGGWIQRIIGGEYGTIFQERSIRRMTYVGTPLVFQFDEIEPGAGTPAPDSVVRAGSKIFYLGHDDFYVFDGLRSIPIGHERVFNTFHDDFDENYYHKVVAGVHPAHPFVFWIYPNESAIEGNPNRIMVYNWVANKWAGPVELAIELVGSVRAESFTLEQLDSFGTLDALPVSLDSREWIGKALNFVAFDSTHKLNTFSGDPLTASFETGDRQLASGRRTLVTNTRPLIEGDSSSSISVAVSGRNKITESATYGAAATMNDEGEAPLFSEGRYHRIRVDVAGGFTHASGVEIDASPGGAY